MTSKDQLKELETVAYPEGGGWRVQTPSIRNEAVFYSRKVTVIKYYNLSLTTRRTINSHDLRKTNHLGVGVRESIVHQ